MTNGEDTNITALEHEMRAWTGLGAAMTETTGASYG